VENKVKITRSRVWLTVGKGVLMPNYWLDSLKEVRNSEVINCHLPQLESLMLAIWAKCFRKKLVVTHHCEFGFTGTLSNKLISVLSFPFHLGTYILADKIVSYTKDYAQNSIFLRMFKNKIEYILPPVVVGNKNENKIKEIKEKIGVDNNEKIVGFVGRIAWEKGLDYLIEAMELVNKKMKAKLVLVGPYKEVAGDKSGEKLKKLIEKNKNKIVLYGPMKHPDLANFYKICDCLVLPSTDNLETFGIVQAEAMISGCPVVASNLPGVRMPVRMTGLGEISKIGDSKDLAKKIVKVLTTKYSQDKFIEAKNIFAIEKFKDSYIKLLNEI
jgi:glycosyltransferase involved in cell wall biosynthesis